ncbi:MAG TPA: S-formylglutathione hydrolase [Parvularculaceae bacterium]|nr:S-formylglutathione hydrolase [Parvularculaceae bacterium]
MKPELISASKSFGGEQRVYQHRSAALKCDMRFSLYMPPHKEGAKLPALFWLSGLTCTEENFIIKSGAQRIAAELGLVLIGPDTSPRGEGVPDDPDGAYDFGLGAGYYVDATEEPWRKHYQMRTYVEEEFFNLALASFPIDRNRLSIFGHSMGGHGALTVALRNPERFRSVSAFAPIVSPMNCPWGEKAFSRYLGADRAAWRENDAIALIEDGARLRELLVDQGAADPYLKEQLKPELLVAACERASVPLTLRFHAGYDHGFFFIQTFIEDHMRWHRERLG